jgi:hypothetical protein
MQCNVCDVQVYQQSFSDAFAALLDLPPGTSQPMVYLYCLAEVMYADGQRADVLMPAQQVKMDSSVPWDILNVHSLKTAAGKTRTEVASQLQKHEAGRLHGYSCRESRLSCTGDVFLAATPVMGIQQHSSVQHSIVKDHLMTPSIPHLKAPVFDPFEEV